MPIHIPGQRFRHSRLLSRRAGKREVTATLSLTAMVDMFTVLVIFLLQNYNVTGQVLFIPKEVILPQAEQIKELKPAVVITVSNKEVLLDTTSIATFEEIQAQESWMIEPLKIAIQQAIVNARAQFESGIQSKLQNAVNVARGVELVDAAPWDKVTIQADKGIDFLTMKKVMYTATEAGAGEINFAVLKQQNK